MNTIRKVLHIWIVNRVKPYEKNQRLSTLNLKKRPRKVKIKFERTLSAIELAFQMQALDSILQGNVNKINYS